MEDFDLATYIATIASTGAGAFLAAYFGAALAIRKHRREFAFQRRLVWTEDLFAALDEAVRILNRFDGSEELSSDWLSTTEKAMILMNRNALYASRRAMDALVQTSAQIVEFRQLLRAGRPVEQLLQRRQLVLQHMELALDVLAFDVREHLGLADLGDRGEFRARLARHRARRAKTQL